MPSISLNSSLLGGNIVQHVVTGLSKASISATMLLSTLLLATTATAIALPPPTVNLQDLLQAPEEKGSLSSIVHLDCDGADHPDPLPFPFSPDDDDTPLPVIVWHGLGDQSNAEGLKEVSELIADVNPGTYVHLITASGQPNDRSASFFGNFTEQLELVCGTLANDPILSTAPAVDAVGFSQGGQFLRGYIERCNNPPVRSLITFGSQHNGISQFQKCKGATDFVCLAANAILKSRTVWSQYVQSHLIPAQYYRDREDYENYLENSNFLADINNEREVKNATYKENIRKLENFVMVVFKDDVTVIPKESGWFAHKNMTSGNVTRLQDRRIYKEDWLGLKELDKKGGLVFEEAAGEHMQLKNKDLKRLFSKYFGPMKEENVVEMVEETVETVEENLRSWFEDKLDL